MNVRLEIASYNKLVFTGEFSDLVASQDFAAWWSQQSILPQGGAIHMRADLPAAWAEMKRARLSREQTRLIAERLGRKIHSRTRVGGDSTAAVGLAITRDSGDVKPCEGEALMRSGPQ